MASFGTKDVAIIKGMIARGDKQHDIAAWFGENQARIVEADQGKFGQASAAPAANLPPKGAPGPKGRRLRSKVTKALEAFAEGKPQEAEAILKDALAGFNKDE